ncbi:MAG: GTPase HflX [Gammaproteobacteria bacterium RIFCSPLOWO2_02_FULL_56_15]|nr:MAG: GTPase HflX [Gammaproteobacteria bacterium RIFCSPLOWO2_02_FULL_56_15]
MQQDNTEKAVLVHINFRNPLLSEEVEEFIQLTESAGLRNLARITGTRTVPNPRIFVGSGKLDEIRDAVNQVQADVVVFNHGLSPSQARNLEGELGCRVIDRIGLILDIFAQRARSHEGKLQVELAQLEYLSTRLVRGWTHLERQKGGIGLRGPGETQLETDRRLISKRIKTIHLQLAKVRCRRQQGKRLRKRTGTPVVSMVGYTNAGKTTLFNKLTGAGLYAADKLFATLDTTLRQVYVASGKKAILSDTVGFIRHIPPDLVRAFHGTLEEISDADLLLHVVDCTDKRQDILIRQVNDVITEIGAAHVPQIMVYSKIDAVPGQAEEISRTRGDIPEVWVSARSGAGIEGLLKILDEHLAPVRIWHTLKLPPDAGGVRACLFRSGLVLEETVDDSGNWIIDVMLDSLALQKFCHENGLDVNIVVDEL